jgi:hypothetical protein
MAFALAMKSISIFPTNNAGGIMLTMTLILAVSNVKNEIFKKKKNQNKVG